jgi:dihydrofolate reductase
MNAANKVVFSRTIRATDWTNVSIASGDLGTETEKLKLDGDGYIVAHGGIGFWRSLIGHDLIDEYHVSVVPYLAGQGITELAFRRLRYSES